MPLQSYSILGLLIRRAVVMAMGKKGQYSGLRRIDNDWIQCFLCLMHYFALQCWHTHGM